MGGFGGGCLEVGGDPARPGDEGAHAGRLVEPQVGADLVHPFDDGAAVLGVDREEEQGRLAVAGDRADAVGDPRHRGEVVPIAGCARERVEDRRRPGQRQPVEAVADPPDRPQVPLRQPARPFEDDHDRHLFAAAGDVLQRLHRPRRFRIGGQEAALPGCGHIVDVRVGDEPGRPEQEPDRDRHPAPAGAGDHPPQANRAR